MKVAALAAVLVGAAAPASGSSGDVVVHGPAFPDGSAFLTFVPCSGFFAPGAQAPTLRINRGPGVAPAGARSFGLEPPGPGTASGPAHGTTSLAGVSLSFSVFAPAPTTGVAYVWYAAPDAPAGHAWRGTAALTAPAGAWTRVDLAATSFAWTLVDLATRTETDEVGAGTVADFVGAHGDGPGSVVGGFGCDGRSFQIDALTVGSVAGATTYDLEGLQLATTMEQVRPGPTAVLRGVTREADGTPVGEPLVLEAAPVGTEQWSPVGEPVRADREGVVQAEVTPDGPTAYRWRMPDTEYAAGHVSESVVVGGH